MLLALKKNQSFYAAKITSENTAIDLLAKHIGLLLDNHHSDLLVEILQLESKDISVFKNISEQDFIKLRHEVRTISDPLGLYDSITTYHPFSYILFDLDQNKILIPDYHNHDDDYFLYETSELNDLYDAYKYAIGFTYNKPINKSLDKNWVLASPIKTNHFRNNTLISTTLVIRENKPESKIVDATYCFCCNTFTCKCDEDELESYCDGLPF